MPGVLYARYNNTWVPITNSGGGMLQGAIPATADWNTYTTPGMYSTTYPSSPPSTNFSPGANEFEGVLLVTKGTGNQLVQTWEGGDYLQYRTYNTDTSAWRGWWSTANDWMANEVFVGATAPVGTNWELWYDTDDEPTAGLTPVAVAGNAFGIVAMGSVNSGNPLALTANTTTQVTGNISYTTVVGRRYRLVVAIRAIQSTAALTSPQGFFRDGTNALYTNGPIWNAPSNTGGYETIHHEYLFDGDGIARNFNFALSSPNVATNLYTATSSSGFFLEDVGPNSAPALPIPDTYQSWTPLTLIAPWANAGNPNNLASYRRIGDEVQVKGLIKNATNQTSVFGNFPVGFRPLTNYFFTGHCTVGSSTNAARIDVFTSGDIRVLYTPAGATIDSLSLDQVRFSVTP